MDTDTVIKGEYIVVFKKDAENFDCKCLLYQASACTIISLSLHAFAQLTLHATKLKLFLRDTISQHIIDIISYTYFRLSTMLL